MILSANWASPSQQAVVIVTDDRGPVLVTTEADQQALDAWIANGGTVGQVPVTAAQVIAERDRRTAAGTTIAVPGIGDIPVSGSPIVQADLTALATAAQIAMAAGNTEATFPFRDRLGATHGLSNEQVLALYMTGLDWLASMRASAWALTDSDPIPADFADDKHWP